MIRQRNKWSILEQHFTFESEVNLFYLNFYFSKYLSSALSCILLGIYNNDFYPTALKGCRGIVFTHGVRMGGQVGGNSLSGLYLRNRKV